MMSIKDGLGIISNRFRKDSSSLFPKFTTVELNDYFI